MKALQTLHLSRHTYSAKYYMSAIGSSRRPTKGKTTTTNRLHLVVGKALTRKLFTASVEPLAHAIQRQQPTPLSACALLVSPQQARVFLS